MQVHHRTLAPVLILGHGNSGTSILSRLLRNYLRVSFGTESQFIVRFANNLRSYGDLQNDTNLRHLIQDISRERWFQRCHKKWGFEVDCDAVFDDVQTRTYRGVLDAVFLQLARHNDMAPRWGDKTPEYTTQLDVIGPLFPDAKYIHLVRDGRDVALSLMGRFWGPRNIYTAACDWKNSVDAVDAFAATCAPGQFMTVTYEQLLTDPVSVFREFVTFLEIDDPDGSLDALIAERLPLDLKRDNFDKWRSRLSPSQCRLFERVAGDVLKRHGFPQVVTEPLAAPSFFQRAYWVCDDRIRKWCDREYWQDNVYKLRLKSRELMRALLPKATAPATSRLHDSESTSGD